MLKLMVFLILLFLIIYTFFVSLPFCNILYVRMSFYNVMFYVRLYMFVSICLYIVSDDENKDDQS